MQSIFVQPTYQLLAALLTVCLFYLAFPSGGIGFLAWLVMIPLYVFLPFTTSRSAFWLGLLAATLGWMASIWWVIDGLSQVLASYHVLITLLIFGFCLIAALPYALSCCLHRYFNWGTSLRGAVFSSATITSLVVFTPHLLPGNIVHSLYLSPYEIQLADIGSVGLIFFIIHLFSILIAYAITQYKKSSHKAITALLISVALYIVNIGYGYYRINQISAELNEQQTTLTVGMVQPNLSIKLRTREAWLNNKEASLNFIKNLVDKVDFIVMPEIPVPVSYEYFKEDKISLKNALNDKKHPTLFFTAIEPIDGQSLDKGYYNTIEMIQQLSIVQRYQKQTLVPFAEYLPFEDQIPWLRDIFPNAPIYKPGKANQLLNVMLDSQVVKFLPLICYEAVFNENVLHGVNQGANILLNTVNDGWFGETSGAKVHFSLSLFRAIETRTPLIRATNNGISAVIHPTGEVNIHSVIKSGVGDISISHIKTIEEYTFYQRYPNAFKYLCLLFMACGLLLSKQTMNRQTPD